MIKTKFFIAIRYGQFRCITGLKQFYFLTYQKLEIPNCSVKFDKLLLFLFALLSFCVFCCRNKWIKNVKYTFKYFLWAEGLNFYTSV